AAALRPRIQGGFVVATERGFALDDGVGTPVRALPEVWIHPTVRMNEGGCDPHGRFYCGSMAYDARPGAGSLHRLDPDRSVSTVLTGVTISNGLAWNLDGSGAYYVDTATQRIDVFDYEEKSGLTNRRPVVSIPPEAGAPDGLTVDADGGVWVALWGGGAVRRYSPEGHLDEIVEVPVAHVTACTFGGQNLEHLFITTSRHGQPSADPAAGSLFRATPGVSGLPVQTFNG
ncbi:MAG: SMP-30/gluconolactonase/LRE family protein, partial [Actinomycetota bacterium]|nr:SMP-30/gluconolactonase/LRE family protein [Actinomycetota bacterium]